MKHMEDYIKMGSACRFVNNQHIQIIIWGKTTIKNRTYVGSMQKVAINWHEIYILRGG